MNITEEQKGLDTLNKKELSILEMIEHWSKSFGLPIEKKAGFPDEKRVDISVALIAEASGLCPSTVAQASKIAFFFSNGASCRRNTI